MRKGILEETRKKQRKKRKMKILFFLLLAVFLAAGIVFLFYVSKFHVNSIKVEGNEILNSEQIISKAKKIIAGKYFYILPKDNIFIIPEKEIKNALSQDFLRIKNISILADFPSNLTIKIEERKPFALLCKKEILECAFLDENGFIFEKAPFFSGSVFTKFFNERNPEDLSLNRQLISEEQCKKLIEFMQLLDRENINITEIFLKNERIYNLFTSEGWYILLDEKDDVKIAFDNLKLALENQIKEKRKNLEYIDLRLDNKVFFKFK